MRRIGALAVALLLPASFASAVTIKVGNLALQPGQVGDIQVLISDAGNINSYSAFALIGDGGPGAGGTDDPTKNPNITNGNSIAGIFSTNNTGNQFTNFELGPMLGNLIALTATAGTFVNANGPDALLGTFQITVPAGTPLGDYTIALADPGGSTNITPAPTSGYELVAGTISVIPEPASVLMLIGALPFLRRRSA